MYLLKTDFNGNLLWSRWFGINGVPNNSEYAFEVKNYFNIGCILFGQVRLSNGRIAHQLIRIDLTGNVIWHKSYSLTNHDLMLRSGDIADDGSILIAGVYLEPNDFHPSLLKTNSTGDVIWFKIFRTPLVGEFWSIKNCPDNNYILTIEPEGIFIPPYIPGFGLVKVSQAGNLLWSKIYNYSGYGFPQEVIVCSDGGFAAVGYDYSNTNNILFVKSDSSGNTGCNDSLINLVVVDSVLNISSTLLTGNVAGDSTISLYYSTDLLTDSIICIDSTWEVVTEILSDLLPDADILDVFPNPTDNILNINPDFLGKEFKIQEIIIYNSMGEVVLSRKSISRKLQETIDVSKFTSGVYFVKIRGEKIDKVIKFIRQ
jgi:hypothetical protein